jgi:hypothetical protein
MIRLRFATLLLVFGSCSQPHTTPIGNMSKPVQTVAQPELKPIKSSDEFNARRLAFQNKLLAVATEHADCARLNLLEEAFAAEKDALDDYSIAHVGAEEQFRKEYSASDADLETLASLEDLEKRCRAAEPKSKPIANAEEYKARRLASVASLEPLVKTYVGTSCRHLRRKWLGGLRELEALHEYESDHEADEMAFTAQHWKEWAEYTATIGYWMTSCDDRERPDRAFAALLQKLQDIASADANDCAKFKSDVDRVATHPGPAAWQQQIANYRTVHAGDVKFGVTYDRSQWQLLVSFDAVNDKCKVVKGPAAGVIDYTRSEAAIRKMSAIAAAAGQDCDKLARDLEALERGPEVQAIYSEQGSLGLLVMTTFVKARQSCHAQVRRR